MSELTKAEADNLLDEKISGGVAKDLVKDIADLVFLVDGNYDEDKELGSETLGELVNLLLPIYYPDLM